MVRIWKLQSKMFFGNLDKTSDVYGVLKRSSNFFANLVILFVFFRPFFLANNS